jgi:radical SAM protein with 4Fe4S-binding SPASM domain
MHTQSIGRHPFDDQVAGVEEGMVVHIHSYSAEEFGFVVAFREGYIGLYSPAAARLCAAGADSDALAPYKLDALTITPDFHLRAPLIVWIEMTRACNLRCRHCFVSASTAQPGELSTAQVFSLLDELKARGVTCIVLSGGEPLVRDDCLSILDYAVQCGFIIAVVTNGFLLSESLVRRIPRGHLRITISLDNLHFGEADTLSADAKLSYLQSRLLLLKEHGIACHVAVTMTRQNLAQLKTICAWLTDHGIGYRGIPFSPIGRGACSPELQLTTAEVADAAELWAMDMRTEQALQAAQHVLTFDQCFDFTFTLVYMARACKGARFIAYVCADGDVYPCTTCVGASLFRLGNITTSSFGSIWDDSSRGFRQLSRWDNFQDCGKCSLSTGEYFCTNRCPPLSLLYRSNPCACGATTYDKASLVRRTRMLPQLLRPVESR